MRGILIRSSPVPSRSVVTDCALTEFAVEPQLAVRFATDKPFARRGTNHAVEREVLLGCSHRSLCHRILAGKVTTD